MYRILLSVVVGLLPTCALSESAGPTIITGRERELTILVKALRCFVAEPEKPQISLSKPRQVKDKFQAAVLSVPEILTTFAAKVVRDLRAHAIPIVIQVIAEHLRVPTVEFFEGKLVPVENELGFGVVGLHLPVVDRPPIAGILYTPLAAHQIYLSMQLSATELVKTLAHELAHAWLRIKGHPWRHPEADSEIDTIVTEILRPSCQH